ncbi:glycosyl hydrolase family 16 [Pseudoalteromonas sp. NBT06-2]|uniref:glycoside hydrolase family 16 protein n=1 Tax=Pseudoalteromonas sp. NBT06-2 TaxID=2025950 RepID=UPI000BA5BAEE|nr:glycoside hydrolase family 16 protein [Pseudoalteromonas sp. NBT06-2]PAJ76223.1 glycosyl hydrolase family 16 [Pseudoalteromonas sp. NBT06-2]
MNKAIGKFTQLCALASLASLQGCGGGVETNTDTSNIYVQKPVSDWEMIWSDEFDGSRIDSNKWTHEVNCLGGGNDEKQCYTDSSENSYIADGVLNIVALPSADGAEQPYSSARLISQHKADFKYGRFEIKAKLPSGQGSWPAFWMLPTDATYGGWPKSGEIDILEAVNLKTVNDEGIVESQIHGTLHYGKESPDNSHSGKAYAIPDGINPADDFHTYAIEWQEGEIRWYLDDYLYATQRQSQVRYNSKDQAVGLAHQGWFAEYYDLISGELSTHWDAAPFDQRFFMIINFAVGGNWPENVNNLGVDANAFTNGQRFEVDYVRVYQCNQNPDTGKGCETIRAGYDSLDDALVVGKAPIPSPPSTGIAQNLTIFSGTLNPNWPAWDCCGDSNPSIVNDVDKGDVMEFVVGETATVNGFISREANIVDPEGKVSPFDASPIIDSGFLSFDMKVVSPPNNTDAAWVLKVESVGGTEFSELELNFSEEGLNPVTGQWQTYTFPVQQLVDAGLDPSAIDVVMIFPAWGVGEGAVYQVTNLEIAADISSPKLMVFEDEENTSWPMWDCCGGSLPTIEMDDEIHGSVAQFSIGAEPTVMGFISREANITVPDVQPAPFDATGILANGVIQFDMKVVDMPNKAEAAWVFKTESNNADTFAQILLNESLEASAPVKGEWQTYTFKLSDLANAGLDVSAIDVLMIFPTWGEGEGAVYRVDNVTVYDPNASDDYIGHVLFNDKAKDQWSIWDCCGGSTPTIENDDTEHGLTAEFIIGSTATVMGLKAADDVYLDASNLLANGLVQFEMKVITASSDPDSTWVFKIESGDVDTFAEFELSASQEGVAPVIGQWQTYTFSLQSLFDAGLDISQIDVLMVFPAWVTGEGAVYRLDNVVITTP